MTRTALRFLIPSTLGVLVFLTPIPWNGQLNIGIGIITSALRQCFGDAALPLVVLIMVITAVMTLIGTLLRPAWLIERPFLRELFAVPAFWVVLRLAGACFALCYLFQIGPALLQSEAVGGAVYVDIAVNVAMIYISACLLLPLLTDFGLLEFAGTLARPVFTRLFRLPGHAAIDALASFVGASSIGLLITIGQHDRGAYSAREAAVIATNFSIVSIPFSFVVASVAGIDAMFLSWYATVVVACLAAALITPRLPPLSRKPEAYRVGGAAPPATSQRPLLAAAWQAALQRAADAPDGRAFLRTGFRNMAFFLFSVITAAMALATVATVLVFETPVFTWLGMPFVPLLELLQLPDAAAAAPGLFAGFLDQFMPALVAGNVGSDVARFVLAGLSVCQLLYMSETGVIILRSSLPISFAELVTIFLLRTAIVLPVLVLGAHWLVA